MAFSFHFTLSFSFGGPGSVALPPPRRSGQQKNHPEKRFRVTTTTDGTKRQKEDFHDRESLRTLQVAQTIICSCPTRKRQPAPFSITNPGEDPLFDAQTTDLQGKYSSSSSSTSLEHLSLMRPRPLNASLDEDGVTGAWGKAGKTWPVGSQSMLPTGDGAVETGGADGDRAIETIGRRTWRDSGGRVEQAGKQDRRNVATVSDEECDRSDEEFGGDDWQEVDSNGSV